MVSSNTKHNHNNGYWPSTAVTTSFPDGIHSFTMLVLFLRGIGGCRTSKRDAREEGQMEKHWISKICYSQ